MRWHKNNSDLSFIIIRSAFKFYPPPGWLDQIKCLLPFLEYSIKGVNRLLFFHPPRNIYDVPKNKALRRRLYFIPSQKLKPPDLLFQRAKHPTQRTMKLSMLSKRLTQIWPMASTGSFQTSK